MHQNLPDDVLCDEVFVDLALFDQLRHISVFAILHHNVQLSLVLYDNFLVILDNIGVDQLGQRIDFTDELLLLPLLHLSVV